MELSQHEKRLIKELLEAEVRTIQGRIHDARLPDGPPRELLHRLVHAQLALAKFQVDLEEKPDALDR
jgi:hypothetical protein